LRRPLRFWSRRCDTAGDIFRWRQAEGPRQRRNPLSWKGRSLTGADLHGFHADSALVLVLNVPLSTMVVVVVVGLVSTTVHFLVVASRTT
jgi:hypothetical protein